MDGISSLFLIFRLMLHSKVDNAASLLSIILNHLSHPLKTGKPLDKAAAAFIIRSLIGDPQI